MIKGNIFNYNQEVEEQIVPFIITGKEDLKNLTYDLPSAENCSFVFARVNDPNLVWKYTYQIQKDVDVVETRQGYFKLSKEKQTMLTLNGNKPDDVNWVRFTAIHPENPQRRAWFSPIRGPSFKQTSCDPADIDDEMHVPELSNNIYNTSVSAESDFTGVHLIENDQPVQHVHPVKVDIADIRFDTLADDSMCAYTIQLFPIQQKKSANSGPEPTPVLQNVHGYFKLDKEHPTRIDLRNSWRATKDYEDAILYKVYCAPGKQPVVKELPLMQPCC
jgi:hypothetical protein